MPVRHCRYWACALALAIICAAGPAARATDVSVTMTGRETFEPRTLTVHAGDIVTWKNTSSAVHTVTDDPKLAARPEDASLPKGAEPFNSGFLRAGEVYRHRFAVPGTYRYFCLLHEAAGMVGTIVVK